MDLIANILLAAGAFGAAAYCAALSRKLARFSTLEGGVGGAIAVLSAQVDDMTKALQKANAAATTSRSSLAELTERAESVAKRMELLIAAMHDLPDEPAAPAPAAPNPDADGGERRMTFVRRRRPRDAMEEA
ncbi:MAG: DUF6468 domain-containing protein [Paracoccaceae bacterium]